MIIVVTESENLRQLVEAVVVWTGYGREMMPNRDDSKVVRQFAWCYTFDFK